MRFGASQTFSQDYRVHSAAFFSGANSGEVEKGDKIILPASALQALARLQVDYPMVFRLTNPSRTDAKVTHCGVMEFSAAEGVCYMPHWMMENLCLQERSVINVTNVSLKKATFIKLQPDTYKFIEITNPKAVLEITLRKFTCLTEGDTICIPFNSKKYYLNILEVRPDGRACIVETDAEVDFAPPAHGRPPWEKDAAAKPAAAASAAAPSSGAAAAASSAANLPPEPEAPAPQKKLFPGSGSRIDGKAVGANVHAPTLKGKAAKGNAKGKAATNPSADSQLDARKRAAAAAHERWKAKRANAQFKQKSAALTKQRVAKYASKHTQSLGQRDAFSGAGHSLGSSS